MDLATVPLRLSDEERVLHNLLMSALNVCEYVNNVDVPDTISDSKRLVELQDVYKVMLSMLISSAEVRDKVKSTLKKGGAKGDECLDLIAQMFEVGRRYKRMNPNKMRSEYGKMMWVLMDAAQGRGRRSMVSTTDASGAQVITPVCTVKTALSDIGALDLLRDPDLDAAVNPESDAAEKETLIRELGARHGKDTPENVAVIERCIRSIDDARQSVHQSTVSLRKLLLWLDEFRAEGEYSLRIRAGSEGSCLSHDHGTQYQFVKETLTLWTIIQRDMMSLWHRVEDDLLDAGARYRFVNTGQGHHRMLGAPSTSEGAHRCLSEAKHAMGCWVGSSVIHLGDRDVPNALVFIDKYTQVTRIVNPIISVLESLERSSRYPGVDEYVKAKFGSKEKARMEILRDFFRHGFDGSGDDGGSCIDGRLTSAWNWCSVLAKKPYYPLFLLCGFVSFDGMF
eukprot:PhM_4_TR7132/c0_g1_i1/m.89823